MEKNVKVVKILDYKRNFENEYIFVSFNVGPYCSVEYNDNDGETPCTLRIFYN